MHIGNTVAEQILNNLRNSMEGDTDKDGFVMVYLDNARKGMNDKVFRANLAVLSKLGLYRVVDGYAWGMVKEKDK
jgi:hypothetical protein